jgi:hypothetical protein
VVVVLVVVGTVYVVVFVGSVVVGSVVVGTVYVVLVVSVETISAEIKAKIILSFSPDSQIIGKRKTAEMMSAGRK